VIDPTIDQLRMFCAVVEHRSFVRAAQTVHMSQPHVSRMIQDLEKRIGQTLLVRTSRGVFTTPPGQVMYEESQRTLQCLDEGLQRVSNARQTTSETLTVGFLSSTHTGLLQALSSRFSTECPTVELRLHEMHTAEQCRQLANGDIDAGIVRPPVSLANAKFAALYSERLVVVSSPAFPFRTPPAITELADLPIVAYQSYLGGAPVVAQQAFSSVGIRPRVVADAPSTQVLLEEVNSGKGVAVVPEPTLHGLVGSAQVYYLEPPVYCTVSLVWRADHDSFPMSVLRDIATSLARSVNEPDQEQPPTS